MFRLRLGIADGYKFNNNDDDDDVMYIKEIVLDTKLL